MLLSSSLLLGHPKVENSNLQTFSATYLSVDVKEKRLMLGSMFPEKIQISNGKPRTARLNSFFETILLTNKELKGQKKGQTQKKIEFVQSSGPDRNRTCI